MWQPGSVMPMGMPMREQQIGYLPHGTGFAQPPLPVESIEAKPPPLPDQLPSEVNPAPPVEPPKQEQPPLPPEPPPPPPNDESGKELMPKDETEQMKLTALQQQAAQWQQHSTHWQQVQQWQQQYGDNVQMYQQSVPSLEAILEEERQFDIQYREWKKQYNDWREQNKNHPNQEQFSQYEQQWKTYELQMEQKRHSILLRKEQAMQQGQYPMPQVSVPSCPPVPSFVHPPAPVAMTPLVSGPPPPPAPPPPPTFPPLSTTGTDMAPSVGNQVLHPSQPQSFNSQQLSNKTQSGLENKTADSNQNSQSGFQFANIPSSARPSSSDSSHQAQPGGSSGNKQMFSQQRYDGRDEAHGPGLDAPHTQDPPGKQTKFGTAPGPTSTIRQGSRFEGPPGQRPRFEGPTPSSQVSRFEGPQPSRGPRFDGPFGQRPRFDGPSPSQGPRFDSQPSSQGPRFEGPPGQRPRFDGPPPSQGPRCEGPLGQQPRFNGPPSSQGPRFDGPPGQQSRFDGPPPAQGPRFEGPLSQGPRFEGPSGQRPPFDGPPGKGSRFEGPSSQRPRFEGPPSQGPRFDGPHGQGPGFEGRGCGYDGKETEYEDAGDEANCEYDDSSFQDADYEEPAGHGFDGPTGPRPQFPAPPGQKFRFEGPSGQRGRLPGPPIQRPRFPAPVGQKAQYPGQPGRGQSFSRPFPPGQRGGRGRGQAVSHGAPVSLLDLKLDRPPTLGKSDVIQDDMDFEQENENMEGSQISGDGRGLGERGGLQRPFMRGRGILRARGNFGRGIGRAQPGLGQEDMDFEGGMESEEMGGGEAYTDYAGSGRDLPGQGTHDASFRGHSWSNRGLPPSNQIRGRGGQRMMRGQGVPGRGGQHHLQSEASNKNISQDYTMETEGDEMQQNVEGHIDPGPSQRTGQTGSTPADFNQTHKSQLAAGSEKQHSMTPEPGNTEHGHTNTQIMQNVSEKSHEERGLDQQERRGMSEPFPRSRWDQNSQEQSDKRGEEHLYRENRSQQEHGSTRWDDGQRFDYGHTSLATGQSDYDRPHQPLDEDLRRDRWDKPNNKDGFSFEGDMHQMARSREGWNHQDRESQGQFPGNRNVSSQEEQKPAVPILSQRELDLIKQATEELKMIQKNQQSGQDAGVASVKPVISQSQGEPLASGSEQRRDWQRAEEREFPRRESLIERQGGRGLKSEDHLHGSQTYDHLDPALRYPRREPYPERLFDDPYRFERLRPPLRGDVYDHDPLIRPYERDYMLSRDPLAVRDPLVARERLLQRDPLLVRDPLLARDPLLPRDPLLATDSLYDVPTTPQVIDYGHGQTDDDGRMSQRERERRRSRSPNRERDYDGRYRGDNRGRDLSRAFDDRDRHRQDRHHYERDRYRGRDHDGHQMHDRDHDRRDDRDRRDEQDRSHNHGNDRIRDNSRRDRPEERHSMDHHDSREKRNSPNIKDFAPPSFSSLPPPPPSSSSTYSKSNYSQCMPPRKDIREKSETILVDEILSEPGRSKRPDHIVVIVRGLPGAGKSYLCKLLKDKEKSAGGSAARILALDDYFMVEVEQTEQDKETGKRVKKSVMQYEYDPDLEEGYKQSFLKSFRRQIDDGYFNFFIIDAIFDKIDYLQEFWAYAKAKGFQVYVSEVTAEPALCAKRNIHKRTLEEIQKMADTWEPLPSHYIQLDVRSLLQDAAITEVEMEDTTETSAAEKEDSQASTAEEEDSNTGVTSKWEIDTSDAQLDKLDGLRYGKMSVHHRMEDYLQLPEDYDTRTSEPGKKRVRWADIEERKSQARMRDIGFVLGQTNWDKMVDDSYAERALNQTKYI